MKCFIPGEIIAKYGNAKNVLDVLDGGSAGTRIHPERLCAKGQQRGRVQECLYRDAYRRYAQLLRWRQQGDSEVCRRQPQGERRSQYRGAGTGRPDQSLYDRGGVAEQGSLRGPQRPGPRARIPRDAATDARRAVRRTAARADTLGGVPPRVLDSHAGVRIRRRNRQALILQERDVLGHAPLGLVQTVLDRVANTGEAWVSRGLDDQGITQIDHLCLSPAALRIAWQVPVGTSLV